VGAYVASKAAVWHLSGSLAYEVAQFGVEVGIIEPGAYSTEFRMDSLRMNERALNGESPYGAQTQETQKLVGALLAASLGPDHFGQHVAGLVDAPEITFWNIVASEDHREMLEALPKKTFEEQGAFWREAVPGVIP
jgi:NAD(P)-dependent dehydrogenase (short-subunit alcohol dehydrogenase family)